MRVEVFLDKDHQFVSLYVPDIPGGHCKITTDDLPDIAPRFEVRFVVDDDDPVAACGREIIEIGLV